MPVSRIKTRLANRMAVAVTASVALSGVSAARDKTCAPVRNEAVVDALNQLFEAASHDDDKLFNEILAPNFYAFDNGKRFDGMQLAGVRGAALRGTTLAHPLPAVDSRCIHFQRSAPRVTQLLR